MVDIDGDNLIEDYKLTVDRQDILLKRQQDTIDSLKEQLLNLQDANMSKGKQQQTKMSSLIEQTRAIAAEQCAHEIHLLKQEKDMALKEKELSQAEAKRHAQEIQRLQTAAVTTPIPTVQLDSKIEAEFHRVTQALEEEASKLRGEINEAEEEKLATLKLNVQLKREISSLTTQLEESKQEKDILKEQLSETHRQLIESQSAIDQLTTKLTRQEEDMKILIGHVESLKRSKDQLVGVLNGVNGKLKEGQSRVAQSIRTAEDAVREKDAALLREKHIREEVRRLEATVGSVGDEAGRKVQEEISKLKLHHAKSVKLLTQEIGQLQLDVGQKQLDFERAMSSLKKAEGEVERLEGEIQQNGEERRVEAVNTIQHNTSLETRIHQLESELQKWRKEANKSLQEREDERSEIDARVQELEGRLSSVLEDCAAAKLQARQAKSLAENYASELAKAKYKLESMEDYYKRQLQVKEDENEGSALSVKARLDAAETIHKDTLQQLYQNMSALQEGHSKMQDQMNEERQEWEKRVSELMVQIAVSRDEARHAIQKQRHAETKLLVSQEEVMQYTTRLEDTEERLRSAERRFASTQFDININNRTNNNSGNR